MINGQKKIDPSKFRLYTVKRDGKHIPSTIHCTAPSDGNNSKRTPEGSPSNRTPSTMDPMRRTGTTHSAYSREVSKRSSSAEAKRPCSGGAPALGDGPAPAESPAVAAAPRSASSSSSRYTNYLKPKDVEIERVRERMNRSPDIANCRGGNVNINQVTPEFITEFWTTLKVRTDEFRKRQLEQRLNGLREAKDEVEKENKGDGDRPSSTCRVLRGRATASKIPVQAKTMVKQDAPTRDPCRGPSAPKTSCVPIRRTNSAPNKYTTEPTGAGAAASPSASTSAKKAPLRSASASGKPAVVDSGTAASTPSSLPVHSRRVVVGVRTGFMTSQTPAAPLRKPLKPTAALSMALKHADPTEGLGNAAPCDPGRGAKASSSPKGPPPPPTTASVSPGDGRSVKDTLVG
jgi:hypothetical protein